MKFDKIIVLCIVLLTLMTISCVEACENNTLNDNSSINENIINTIDDNGKTIQTDDESNATNDSSANQTNEDLKEDYNIENDSYANHQDLIKFRFKSDVYKDEALYVYFECKNKTVTGDLSVFIDGNFIETVDVNAEWLLSIDLDKSTPLLILYLDGYAMGNHTLNMIYSGNDYYSPFNETFEFNIVNVLIDFDEKMEMGDNIRVKLPYNATGIVTIRINETKKQYNLKNIKSDDECKYIDYELKNLKYDTYEVEVNYTGNYGNITKKGNITLDYDFFFFDGFGYKNLIEYSKDYDFVYFIGPHKNIILLIDGVKVPYYSTHNKEGGVFRNENEFYGMIFDNAPIWFSDFSLSQGYHTIEVKYPGSKSLPAKSIKDTFYVSKAHFAKKSNILVNSKNTVKFIFPKNTKGKFSLYTSQDNKKFKLVDRVTIKNNVAKIDVSHPKVGKYYIKAVYNTGKGNKVVKTTYKCIPAILKKTATSGMRIPITSNGKDTFKLVTGEKVKGTFSVYINEKLYKSVKIKNGNTKITVPYSAYNKKEGSYTLKCVWKTNYGNGKKSIRLHVYDATNLYFADDPYNENIYGYNDNNIFYGDKFTYSLQVIEKNGKSAGKNKVVTFKVGKHTFKVKTDKKGVATLKLSNKILPGTYTITATYKKEKYQQIFWEDGKDITQKLRVKQVLKLSAAKIKKSSNEIFLKATLKNKNPMKGKTITFKFAGKTYKAKTNSDGIAKVNIEKSVLKNLKAGKYITYSATFLKNTVEKTAKIEK